jgi:ACS family tartrate transporter-like MFS transporter
MWYYLSQFYPDDRITTPYAATEAAIALSHTIAAPTAAVILSFNGMGGLRGWQWLFLLEGLPSIALGLAMGFILPSGPATAHFLSSEERDIIQSQVASKSNRSRAPPSATKLLGEVVTNWQVWYLSFVKILKDVAVFGTIFWTPKLINDILKGANAAVPAGAGHGHGPAAESADAGIHAVLLTSIPFTLAAVSALWSGHHSQATGERHMHVAIPYMIGGAVLSLFPLFLENYRVVSFLCLVVAIVGAYCGGAPTLALVTSTVSGPAVALALPFFNSVGNLGGFVGPYMVGFIKQRTGSYNWATVILGWLLLISGVMMVLLKYLSHRWRKESDSSDKLLRAHGDRH